MIISIITAVYNNKQGLEKTYSSIKGINKSNDYEWIIIDGGSTDGCVEFCEKHSIDITYWISERDNGVYSAMNKGVKVAHGDYLLFLNSGDTLDEEFLDATWDSIFNDNTDILYGDLNTIDKNGTVKKIIQPEILNMPYFIGGYICHQSILFSRNLFIDDQYDESYKIAADHDFLIRQVFKKNRLSRHINITICMYEDFGMSAQVYYSHTKPELRRSISNILPGGEYWYDSVLMRKELNDEKLFTQLQYISTLNSAKKATRIAITFVIELHKLISMIKRNVCQI